MHKFSCTSQAVVRKKLFLSFFMQPASHGKYIKFYYGTQFFPLTRPSFRLLLLPLLLCVCCNVRPSNSFYFLEDEKSFSIVYFAIFFLLLLPLSLSFYADGFSSHSLHGNSLLLLHVFHAILISCAHSFCMHLCFKV
jgi:hypothetical protein